ncbi:O-methyltransferase [Eudoraea chungangensis]|uniref:O-methyltransferase n=1 Tax=Eudoraea chungangensis TaxID=1481905 RepID=UPI0023EDC117|nr:class I SAM-dependent methyltransferase [Eudoraea chungangensis]
MNDQDILNIPSILPQIESLAKEIGFTMSSDLLTGSLLKALAANKKGPNILELGTGLGFSLCWLLDGMDKNAQLISIDNDNVLIEHLKNVLPKNNRVNIICADAAVWLNENSQRKFDLIFADAWPGKYSQLEEVLDMLNPGGLYIIDDMLERATWPEAHKARALNLITRLEERDDLIVTKLNWSTGIIICTKVVNNNM